MMIFAAYSLNFIGKYSFQSIKNDSITGSVLRDIITDKYSRFPL